MNAETGTIEIRERKFTAKDGRRLSYPVADRMPDGWGVIRGAMTAPKGYTWISNRKSRFKKGPNGKIESQHAIIETSKMNIASEKN